MANRFISSTGSNTSPYDTWAKAATSLTTAITGSASGDVFVIDAAAPGANVAATTTWTFVGNASVIASTNSGTATITPTTMGTTAWLGHDSSSFSITFNGAFKVYFYGITLRTAGTTNVSIAFGTADGMHFELEQCYLWSGTTNASGTISIGPNGAGGNAYFNFKDCTFRFGNTSQGITPRARIEINGGSVSSAGSAPLTLLKNSDNIQSVAFFGTNLSHVTGTLVPSFANSSATVTFSQCRFGAGVTVLNTQTPANKSSGIAIVYDCASGDTHGLFGYYDAFGSVVSDTGIFVTAGAAGQSWKIVTTANCSFGTPFVTPWINLYNTGTSAITPYLEVLRSGSTTAYTDAELWGEFSVKDNSGFTNTDTFSDRQSLVAWAAGTAGASQAAGIGTGSWTGGTTPWSGKIDSGSAITPAETGPLRGRAVVAAPSITVYVDPQIRT